MYKTGSLRQIILKTDCLTSCEDIRYHLLIKCLEMQVQMKATPSKKLQNLDPSNLETIMKAFNSQD